MLGITIEWIESEMKILGVRFRQIGDLGESEMEKAGDEIT